jgi:hypothetical protein
MILMVRAFLKSVFVGALAAALLPLLITACLFLSGFPYHLLLPGSELDDVSLLGGLVGALLPLIIAIAIVLPAALLIGLPTTALLKRFQKESLGAYVGIGIVAGFLLTLAIISIAHSEDLVWLTPFGAFSGAVTARTWWTTAREDVANKGLASWGE